MNPIQVLLAQSIDYAGLFPPAALDLARATANYAEYTTGPEAWGLGRFILPASRLVEFEEVTRSRPPVHWSLSALVGPDFAADLDRVAGFNERQARSGALAAVDTIEAKASSVTAIEEIDRQVPRSLLGYLEVPIERDPGELIVAIGRTGRRAKVRTGGVTADAFPATSDLSRFIRGCVRARVPFKATAGLHHPLRAEYPLTYEANSRRGVMFGFLNLFLGTAFIRNGMDERSAGEVLEESSPATLSVDQRGITWREHRLDLDSLSQAREIINSFGSCSFTEPMGELQGLRLLPSRVQRA
jgi:hypothetical protein